MDLGCHADISEEPIQWVVQAETELLPFLSPSWPARDDAAEWTWSSTPVAFFFFHFCAICTSTSYGLANLTWLFYSQNQPKLCCCDYAYLKTYMLIIIILYMLVIFIYCSAFNSLFNQGKAIFIFLIHILRQEAWQMASEGNEYLHRLSWSQV